MIPFICPAPPKKQLSECFTVHPASPPFRLSAVHACYNPVESIIQTAYNTDINLQCNTYSHFNKSHQNKEDTMVQINKELCIGCGKCVKDCPVFCISITDHKASASGDCMNCGHCAALCPKEAVSIPGYDMDDVEIYDKTTFSLEADTLLRAIKFRRSIRDYKPLPIEKEKLQKVLQAGRYTATAKNNQDCHFIFVQKELAALKQQVWDFIENYANSHNDNASADMLPYLSFNQRRKADCKDDYLFRNAPVVAYITSDWPLDAGLAAQNMELMAVALGLGALYNGYLARITNANEKLKDWLGIKGKTIKACMLLGYPNVSYERTVPRKEADVIWK